MNRIPLIDVFERDGSIFLPSTPMKFETISNLDQNFPFVPFDVDLIVLFSVSRISNYGLYRRTEKEIPKEIIAFSVPQNINNCNREFVRDKRVNTEKFVPLCPKLINKESFRRK